MMDVKHVISRSEIFEDESRNKTNLDSSQDYVLPPLGFDFEIVDVEDDSAAEFSSSEQHRDDKIEEEKKKAKDENVELFNMFSSLGNTSNLVKIKVDELKIEDEHQLEKLNDEEWDQLAKNRNKRPLSYYFQTKDDVSMREDCIKVAIEGRTIYDWNQKFRVLSDYKVIDLKKFNSRVDLCFKIKQEKNRKKNNRKSRMRRDAQIFKKERLINWNKSLERIMQNQQKIPVKDYTMKNPVKYVFQKDGKKILSFDMGPFKFKQRLSKKAKVSEPAKN